MNPTHAVDYLFTYRRISSSKQEKGTGLEQQTISDELRSQLCAEYTVVPYHQDFEDSGVSGFVKDADSEKDLIKDRPAFRELMNTIQQPNVGDGSVLALYNADRLARADTHTAVSLLMNITQYCRLYIVSEGRMFDKRDSNLMVELIMVVISLQRAHDESKAKSARTKGAALSKLQRYLEGERNQYGRPIWSGTGRLPYWLTTDDAKGIVKHPEYFPIAQQMVSMALQGHGITKITQYLNNDIEIPEGRTEWSRTMIAKSTKNPALFGRLETEIDGIPFAIDDYYPPVISKEEYYSIQSTKLKTNRRKGTGATQAVAILGGSNVSKCQRCGGATRVFWDKKKGFMSYGCLNAGTGGNCSGWSISAWRLETVVFTLLADLTFTTQENNNHSQIAVHEAELSTLQKKLTEMLEIFEEMPSKAVGAKIAKLEVEVESKSEELKASQLSHVPTDNLVELTDRWREANTECLKDYNCRTERELLQRLIIDTCNSIHIHKDKGAKDYVVVVELVDGTQRSAMCYQEHILESTLRDDDKESVIGYLFHNHIITALNNKVKARES